VELLLKSLHELSQESSKAERDLKDFFDLLPSSLRGQDILIAVSPEKKIQLVEASETTDLPPQFDISLNHIADINRPYRFFITLRCFGDKFGFYSSECYQIYRERLLPSNAKGWMYCGENLFMALRENVSEFTEQRIELLCKKIPVEICNVTQKVYVHVTQEVDKLGLDIAFLFAEARRWKALQREGLKEIERMHEEMRGMRREIEHLHVPSVAV
jgi:hypothetical protein